jgi:hypothetical protein
MVRTSDGWHSSSAFGKTSLRVSARGRAGTQIASSAVTTAATSAARTVAQHPGPACFPGPGSLGGLGLLVEDFDLAGVDEFLQLRMIAGVRGDLPGPSGA